jgi:uncharacterized protein with PQ loop repeat
MNQNNINVIPYTATSLSVVARLIFMYLLYSKKSTNNYSLFFCILSIISSSMWSYYSVEVNDLPMIIRSSIEISLLFISSTYIIRNKIIMYKNQSQILPI